MEVGKKEFLIKQRLKKEDPVELPMDDCFFELMHNKIMQAVDKIEMKPQAKWSKSKIFLERQGLISENFKKST